MKTYRIEMMDRSSYHEYMMGGYNYSVQYFDIEAETAEEALATAKANNPNLVANEGYIRTVEELEAERKEREARWEAARKAEEEKKAKAKARKEERERAKAEELGLTVEEYRAKVKHEKKVRLAEAEVERLKAELAKAEKYLENLKKEA
jgi:colicin import membrane protein